MTPASAFDSSVALWAEDDAAAYVRLEGLSMRSINLYHFYHLGRRIHPIADISVGMDRGGYFTARAESIGFLQGVHELPDSPFKGLEECDGLLSAISLVEQGFGGNVESPVGAGETTLIKTCVRDLERAFQKRLQAEAVFQVETVGIYKTVDLVEHAEKVFPTTTLSRLSEKVITDWREAGRCLAFELSTASGFHTMRAAESVIHEYYVTVTDDHQMKRKHRNWGAYVRNLNTHKNENKDSEVDAKLTSLIDQVREHHRNPVMHPEVS